MKLPVSFAAPFLLITTILFCLTSCLHEPDLEGVPQVTYSNDVQRIISTQCWFAGCHGPGGAAGQMTTYQEIISFGSIKAGEARKSKLYKAITSRGLVESMPPSGYPEMPAEDIKLIYVWIEQGALNN